MDALFGKRNCPRQTPVADEFSFVTSGSPFTPWRLPDWRSGGRPACASGKARCATVFSGLQEPSVEKLLFGGQSGAGVSLAGSNQDHKAINRPPTSSTTSSAPGPPAIMKKSPTPADPNPATTTATRVGSKGCGRAAAGAWAVLFSLSGTGRPFARSTDPGACAPCRRYGSLTRIRPRAGMSTRQAGPRTDIELSVTPSVRSHGGEATTSESRGLSGEIPRLRRGRLRSE
jgi:hypothetical protein